MSHFDPSTDTGRLAGHSNDVAIFRIGSAVRLDYALSDADTDPLDAFVGHAGVVREIDAQARLLVAFTPLDPMDDSCFWVEARQLTLED